MPAQKLSILIAPDKFKGSLRASEVSQALTEGILSQHPKAHILSQPMADGGDGSIELLHELWKLKEYQVEVSDPLFRPILASYFANEDAAFIEMAQASGLALLQAEERNCLKTTSFGTGQLILDAVQCGFRKINLFIGGSATNDAGLGIANALGYTFRNADGNALSPIGENLDQVAHIEAGELVTQIRKLNLQIICDVNNPFYGDNGAAQVYAPQKGTDEAGVAFLDAGLRHLDGIFEKSGYGSVQTLAGAGAAGGVGGGMVALFGAKLIAGIDLFIDLFSLEEKVKQADVVITGEGRLDSQSFQGKVVGGIWKLCQQHQKPMVIVCGQQQMKNEETDDYQVLSLVDIAPSVEEAISDAYHYLQQAGAEGSVNF